MKQSFIQALKFKTLKEPTWPLKKSSIYHKRKQQQQQQQQNNHVPIAENGCSLLMLFNCGTVMMSLSIRAI